MKSRIINVNFKPIEFDRFKNQAGLNSFALSPNKWIEATGAIGLYAKAGRGGSAQTCTDVLLDVFARENQWTTMPLSGTINK